MSDKTFIATIQGGGFKLDTPYNRARLRQYLSGLEGKKVAIDIRPARHTRSLKQNNYYWGAIVPTFLEIFQKNDPNWTADDVHEELKKEFNYRLLKKGDEYEKVPRSTATLTVGEFCEYVFRIEQYCAENGIYLPQPDDYWKEMVNS